MGKRTPSPHLVDNPPLSSSPGPQPAVAPPAHTSAPPEVVAAPLAQAAQRDKLSRGVMKLNPDIAIGMRAAGVPGVRVAEALGVHINTLDKALAKIPHAEEKIRTYRERLRLIKLVRSYAVEGRLWSRLEREIPSGDARDVDALMRALHAGEKLQASAAGDTKKFEVTTPFDLPPAVELKVLIQNLLGGAP